MVFHAKKLNQTQKKPEKLGKRPYVISYVISIKETLESISSFLSSLKWQ